MKKKRRKIIIIIIIVIILLLCALIAFKLFNKDDKKPINVIDDVKNYNYVLEDRDTQLFKDTFKELKDILNADDINYEKYAQTLSKLYIIDLYTMDNKISKYDVGSSEFIYPDYLDKFKLKATETMYKTIENNVNGKRKQDLPEVTSVEITSTEESTFKIGEEEYSSYVIDLKWNYKKDLGYDDTARITSIKSDNYIYIVEHNEVEE